MSSTDVVKTVSKKLKYYLEIKRREDGFDLSGPDCPKLDHPPTKARPTLMYGGLHDRPLKHYFSPRSAKICLTQFKVDEGGEERHGRVKKKLVRNMQRYQFVESNLPDTYYKKTKGQKILRPETIGFGVQLKRTRSPHKGAYPVLRSTPPDYISKGEVHRLINMATKLLVATETVDLNEDSHDSSMQRSRPSTSKSQNQKNGKRLPKIEKGGKKDGKEKIHVSVFLKDLIEDDVDSSYGTRPSSTHNSYLTIDGEPADDKKVPFWLKEQMTRQSPADNDNWVRPHSAQSPKKSTRPPSGKQRPKSAVVPDAKEKKKKQHVPAKPKDLPIHMQPAAWDLEVCSSAAEEEDEKPVNKTKETTAVQTPGELLREYDPMEKVIWDGEPCRYRVHVHTGSRLGASTKAEVKIILCGDNGRTEERWLHESKNHLIKFQKGQEDIFDLETFYVGPLRKISIGHDRHELGYGWFVDKVYVKDRVRRVRYEIPCDKWLSAKEGDGSTVKEFDVKISTAYEEDDRSEEESSKTSDPPVFIHTTSPRSESPPPKEAPLVKKADSGSHTSVNTIPSESKDIYRNRQDSVASTYTTTSYTSDPSSDDSSDTTPRQRPSSPIKQQQPLTLITRKDDFFDQTIPEKDYASVIESITDDRKEEDFTNDRYSGYNTTQVSSSGDRTYQQSFNNSKTETVTLSLKGVTEEKGEDQSYSQPEVKHHPQSTPQMYPTEFESESDTARISVDNDADSRTPRSRPEEEYMDGFKAGIEAAKKSLNTSQNNNEDNQKVNEAENINKGPSIHTAAKTGDLERIKVLVTYNPALKIKPDEKGFTPLHISASHGQTQVVQWLSVNVTDIDEATPTGYTPIHLASKNGHTQSVMVLAAMGAQLGIETVEHQTALHLAAMGGHIETVKWLVANRASLESEDIMGRTALALATQYNHGPVIEFLEACNKEEQNPNSSLSQLRTRSRESSTSSSSSSDTSDSSDDSSDSDSQSTDSQKWSPDKKNQGNRPASAKGSMKGNKPVQALYKGDTSSTDSDVDMKAKEKHDKEIEEKRKLYDKQHSQMAAQQSSFLDSIRNEYN